MNNMESEVVTVLRNTLIAEETHNAEQQLKVLEQREGYFATLLQIISKSEYPFELKQSAILRLKNTVVASWTIRKGKENRISDIDRKVLKDNLIFAICQDIHHLIRIQLLECVYYASRFDWPTDWPLLIPQIQDNLLSNDNRRMYGALTALRMLFKAWHMKKKEERQPINELVTHIFPFLFPLFRHLVVEIDQNNQSNETFEMQRILIKIFRLSTEYAIPSFFRNPEGIKRYNEWMELIKITLQRPMPPQCLPKECLPENAALYAKNAQQVIFALSKTPFWKCKKWASKMSVRQFERFGRIGRVEEKALKPFAENFQKHLAPQLLEVFFGLLKERQTNGTFLRAIVEFGAYRFLSCALTVPELYTMVKANFVSIMSDFILPTLRYTPVDIQLWSNDPQEFIRRELEEWVEDPRDAAITIIIEMTLVDGLKQKHDILNLSRDCILAGFNYYKSSQDEQRFIIKDAVLRIFGSLKKKFLEEAPDAIEPLLIEHVCPDLTTPCGFLRSRACWVLGKFAKLQWKNQEALASTVGLIFQSLMPDNALPIRFQAAQTIAFFLKNETILEHLQPHLPTLIENYFSLLDVIGSSIVVGVLKVVVERFGPSVAPLAVAVVERLISVFLESMKADLASDENDEEGMTAVECLRCVNAVIDACYDSPEIIARLEVLCAPAMDVALSAKCVDYLECTFDMIGMFAFFSKPISPFLWTLFPRLIDAYHTYADDFIDHILGPIDNFISNGTDVFVSNQEPNYLEMTCKECQSLINSENELFGQYGAKILCSVLAHARGKVDHKIEFAIKLCAERMEKSEYISYKLLLLDVIAVCAHYNPTLFANILGLSSPTPPQASQHLLNFWISHLVDMRKALGFDKVKKKKTKKDKKKKKKGKSKQLEEDEEWDEPEQEPSIEDLENLMQHQKLSILGLSALCQAPIPPNYIERILAVLISCLVILDKEYDTMAEMEEAAEEEGEEVLDSDDWEDDIAYDVDVNDQLIAAHWPGEEGEEKEMNGEESEGEEDQGGEAGEGAEGFHNRIENLIDEFEQAKVNEQHYYSPLDDIDEFVHFAQTLEVLGQKIPQFASHFQSLVKKEKLEKQLNQTLEEAKRRHQEMEEEKQKLEEEKKQQK